jgi:hypothetical protein
MVAEAIRDLRDPARTEALNDPNRITEVIRSARSLAIGSGAVMDAMLRVGHAADQDGSTLMSWADLGEAFGHARTSVRERYLKITDPAYQRPPEDDWLLGP